MGYFGLRRAKPSILERTEYDLKRSQPLALVKSTLPGEFLADDSSAILALTRCQHQITVSR
jgi:hypothetical protein